jgi:hypothetical protein
MLIIHYTYVRSLLMVRRARKSKKKPVPKAKEQKARTKEQKPGS